VKITAIETLVVALPFDMGGPHIRFAGQLWDRMEILLVKVETEDGLVGWGEAFGHAAIPTTRAAIDTIIAPLMLGRDSSDISRVTREVLHSMHLLGRNGPFVFGFAGVEIALWDIAGKRAGVPIWHLLGGSRRDELEAYASLLNYTDPKLVTKNVSAACAAGYRYIKLHETTIEATRAAIAAPGAANAKIMLDVNCAWLAPVAREMADTLSKDALHWLEEPVWPPEDFSGLASVRERGIPIAAGENTAGVFGFKALIDAGAIDIAQPSVTKVGGIGEMVRVIKYCDAQGVAVLPHCPYFGPGLIASYHVASALVKSPLIEVLWLEMEENPFDPWVRTRNGKVRVPDGPGLGVEPDPAILKRYARGAPVRTAGKA
jgi:L-alanine-DL-glutamate epimerase-like enolase superfamily enzyme